MRRHWLSLCTVWPSHRRVTVHGCAVRSPLTGCQVTSRPHDRFTRYSKWLDTFQTDLVHVGGTDPSGSYADHKSSLCCTVTRADNTTDMFGNSQKWFQFQGMETQIIQSLLPLTRNRNGSVVGFLKVLTPACWSQWPRGLRHRSAATRLLRLWVRILLGAWMSVCCECCVLSGRGLCNELITRPEESYRLCCVVVCDLETSRMGAPYIYDISSLKVNDLTLILLTWRRWWAPNNASK